MRLRNTSSYPTDEVRQLVQIATRGVNMSRVCVNVKGRRSGWAGTAYDSVPEMSNAPATSRYLVTLRLAPEPLLGLPFEQDYNGHTPKHQARDTSRFPMVRLETWDEVLVHLAAHEARHVHQFRNAKRCSEVDCERFAVRAVERYREALVDIASAASYI